MFKQANKTHLKKRRLAVFVSHSLDAVFIMPLSQELVHMISVTYLDGLCTVEWVLLGKELQQPQKTKKQDSAYPTSLAIEDALDIDLQKVKGSMNIFRN